jgi:hypothetical protein
MQSYVGARSRDSFLMLLNQNSSPVHHTVGRKQQDTAQDLVWSTGGRTRETTLLLSPGAEDYHNIYPAILCHVSARAPTKQRKHKLAA